MAKSLTTAALKAAIENFFGIQISRNINYFEKAREFIVNGIGPEMVIDIGANEGQWGAKFHKQFPDLVLKSFEPSKIPYRTLQSRALKESNWETFNFGLSNESKKSNFYLASDRGLSSSANRPKLHQIVHKHVRFDEIEKVQLRTLDSMNFNSRSIYLKIDTQGHEIKVIEGALRTLKKVCAIEIETSFIPLYAGEASSVEIFALLKELNFTPYVLGNMHRDKHFRIWNFDTILVKTNVQ